jgi:hypothetical protein
VKDVEVSLSNPGLCSIENLHIQTLLGIHVVI